jgi:hypothetical protein
MDEIVFNQQCYLCKGDGYLIVTNAQWDEFMIYVDDPTEEKLNSTDNFPQFLKNLSNFITVEKHKDFYSMQCTLCHGTKVVAKKITLDDLKKLLA